MPESNAALSEAGSPEPNRLAEAIPPLPENATPEQKDEHWFKYYYRGDQERQLTFRAVMMGGILGMFMSISNLYTTLKLGWAFGVAITACVLSFVIWNSLRAASGKRLSQMGLLENNCMQSTASAAGYSTGGTIGTAFGALLLIEGEHRPWLVVGAFALLTAALGVFLAIPMKRQMINVEQLKFPSGIAAAETLRSLYSTGREAMQKAHALVWALVGSGIIGFLRSYGTLVDVLKDWKPVAWLAGILHGAESWIYSFLEKWHRLVFIPEEIPFTSFLAPISGVKLYGLAFEPSVLLIGAGIITGLRVSLSMLFGSVVLYYFVTPWLYAQDLALGGTAGYMASFTVKNGMINPTRWALWGGTSIMVFSSLTSVALQWNTLVRAFKSFGKSSSREASLNARMAAIEVPMSWMIIGLVPITVGLVLVQYFAFHINMVLGLIAVAMSLVVTLVCCRATGETDTTPIGAMGKLTQLLYAVLAKGNSVTNLMAAGATAAAGGSAADLLTDLKSGYLLGANPRRQFLAQFFGIFFGTLAIVPAWYLMVPDKARLEAFNPPAANMWKAVADLLTQGVHMLPHTAVVAIVIGALLGVLLPLIEFLAPKTRSWLPSAMGLGLAWVIPFQNSLSFAIGAALVYLWTRWHRRSAELYSIPIASGLVAGESLVAALIAITCTLIGFMGLK
jgi:OPT family oligopeptide transporter